MSDTVTIPRSEFNEMKRTLRRIERYMEISDMISEQEACELLEISPKRLRNMISLGSIEPGMYTVCVNNATKRFSRSALMGLKRKVG